MYRKLFLTLIVGAVIAPGHSAGAQSEPRRRIEAGRAFDFSFGDDNANRAVIGVTTSAGSARDTLGVLISSVTPGGPADKAGIEEGTRIAAINGVNLKLNPADVDDWEMASIMSRRLTRELGKVDPGADVELRVYASGQSRTVKVKTTSSDSLYRLFRMSRDDDGDRAAIGAALGSSGSRRDTLGVFVAFLDDDGPAAKAGIEEGNRIAAINGVDVRVSREDAGDEMISQVKARRLEREMQKVKPGDEVTLRVYADGRTRDVKIRTVAASSLRSGRRGLFFGGSAPRMRVAPMPMPPMPLVQPMLPMPIEAARMRITQITI